MCCTKGGPKGSKSGEIIPHPAGGNHIVRFASQNGHERVFDFNKIIIIIHSASETTFHTVTVAPTDTGHIEYLRLAVVVCECARASVRASVRATRADGENCGACVCAPDWLCVRLFGPCLSLPA